MEFPLHRSFGPPLCGRGNTNLMQPQSLFYYLSVPSLLLHHVPVDHESGPEAAVPARLQRRAEPHREEFWYRHSVRQLGVFGLCVQQFQLSRLQLSLRTGAGTSTDTTCSSYKDIHSGFHQLTLSTCLCVQEKSLPGVVMALVCNVFEMLYQLANLDESRYTCAVLGTYLN